MKRIVQWFFCRICIFEPLRELRDSTGDRRLHPTSRGSRVTEGRKIGSADCALSSDLPES
jgi:hypothetical protein